MYSELEEIKKLIYKIFENWYVLDENYSNYYTPIYKIAEDRIFQAKHKHLTEIYTEFFTSNFETYEDGYTAIIYEPVSKEQIKLFAEVENELDKFENVQEEYKATKRRLLSKLKRIEI
jgi:hypothetical protein